MTNQTRQSFKTVPGYTLPVLTPKDLAHLHEMTLQFDIEQIRFTPGSQLSVSGLDNDSFQKFCEAVIPFMKPMPDNGTIIYSCNDQSQCAHEFGDSSTIVKRLAELAFELPLPAKLKVGVAGCYRCCTMVRVRDIGIFPAARNSFKWNLSFGGNGGYNPRIGDIIGTGLNEDELIVMVQQAVSLYRKHGRNRERTAAFVSRFGGENFIDEIKMTPFDPGQGVPVRK